MARVANDTAALQSLEISPDGRTVTWIRNGAAPEIQHVAIEISTNGTHYASLGRAARVDGGWRLTTDSISPGQNFYLRARGRTFGGRNGSSGLVESVRIFYLIPPAHISSAGKLGSGAFQFAFTNATATSYTVLATANIAEPLASWENLGTPVSVGGGVYQFTDHGATNHIRRFYQLRSP